LKRSLIRRRHLAALLGRAAALGQETADNERQKTFAQPNKAIIGLISEHSVAKCNTVHKNSQNLQTEAGEKNVSTKR